MITASASATKVAVVIFAKLELVQMRTHGRVYLPALVTVHVTALGANASVTNFGRAMTVVRIASAGKIVVTEETAVKANAGVMMGSMVRVVRRATAKRMRMVCFAVGGANVAATAASVSVDMGVLIVKAMQPSQ